MTNRNMRYSGLGLALLTAGAIAACSSDPATPSGGAGNGAGGAPGGAGAPAVSGAPGTAGAGVAGAAAGAAPTAGSGTGGTGSGFACAGTLPTSPVITDFSNLVASTTNPGSFTFAGGVLGGTFSYQPNALTVDTLTNTALNVKGNIKAYDGFGLYFNTCYDASAYTGISFNIKGNAGPTGKLNFRVQTNTNTAIDAANSKGACVATSATDTYPDCHAASFDIPVTAAGAVVMVNFVQFKDGMPSATVSAKEIVGLEWAFNWTPGPVGGAGAGAGGAA
ncbi:MAG TPA: hypothetical protein VJV79_32710, partial [Polyangiaceae bacterium]|nr:hypothetical protein [Polyangiaceae bacterium]